MSGILNFVDAHSFASRKHAGQSYGDGDYIRHPEAVVRVLENAGFGGDTNLLTAAILHDTLEDTDATAEELLRNFGDDVASLVDAVTDRPGKNRRERHAATYPYIRGNNRATALKVADRIANVAHCCMEDTSIAKLRMRMYQEEQTAFRSFLHKDNEGAGLDMLWWNLEALFKPDEEETPCQVSRTSPGNTGG